MARRLAARLAPWCLVPAALYVALLPVLKGTASVVKIAALGLAGGLVAVLPAGALWMLETRRGAASAAGALLGASVIAACLLAVTSGAGLEALTVAVLMQVSAYGFGRYLAKGLALNGEDGETWQDVPLRIALGWTVLLIAFLAAGSIGGLTRSVVAAIYLAGVAAAARVGVPASRPVASPSGAAPAVWWWGLVLLLVIGYVGALAPDVRHDALAAHLPIAREFAARGAIVEMRQNTASYFQINADVLYATGMALMPGERVPKLMHCFAGVVACLAVYSLGSRLWNRRAGLIGAAVFAGTPLVWWLAGTGYTDLWTALFTAAALHAVLLYRQVPGPSRAFAAGLLAGAAVGVKISSVAVAAPVLGALLAAARAERRRWATSIAVVIGAALTGAYSYLRAWILVGNPVFPLLRPVFGPPGGLHPDRMLRPLQGMGAGPWDLVLLPWRITRFPERFVEDASLGVVYLALLPLAALAVARRRIPGWIVGVGIVAVLVWFWTSQYLRFALPLLPLVALVAGASAADPSGGARIPTVAAMVTAALLALNAGAWAAPGPPNFPYTVAAGRVRREEYALRHIRGFAVADFARRTLSPDARILGAGEDWTFHYERFFVPISWYGWRFDRSLLGLMTAARDGEVVRRSLVASGFTHLVVYPESRILRRRGQLEAWAAREALWEQGPRMMYAAGGFYLFDLTDPAGARAPGVSLLDHLGGVLAGSGDASFEVAVKAGTLYALDTLARAPTAGTEVEIVVQWLSGRGDLIGPRTARAVSVAAEWRRRAVACTAPPGASRARITLSASGGAVAEFSTLRFYELR